MEPDVPLTHPHTSRAVASPLALLDHACLLDRPSLRRPAGCLLSRLLSLYGFGQTSGIRAFLEAAERHAAVLLCLLQQYESCRTSQLNLSRPSAGLDAPQRQTQHVDRATGSFRPGSSPGTRAFPGTNAEHCSARRQRLEQQQLQTGDTGPESPMPTARTKVQAGKQRQRQRDHRQGRDFSSEADLPCRAGQCNVACPHCQAQHWLAERTAGAGTNARPVFGMCCDAGTVQLPALSPSPAVLANLLSAQTARGQAFRENIRRYNVSLAMASSGGNFACKGCSASVQCNVAGEMAFMSVISLRQ